ncbi:10179_t:CDS:2 [Cetraspora pellucida]|uniref:10179_t:CDS:1 n=1 Tax=Cetraspora pellucida TaxID=1433469 RepID=A0ACA9JWM2_9GLOM|nr:10179_t:CDS:2 [Cetraspora pellucida]
MFPHLHTGKDIEIQLRSILDIFNITIKDFKEIVQSVDKNEIVYKILQNALTR